MIESDPPHPVIFQGITADSIREAALKVEGGAGPSGLDARDWRRLSTSFGMVSDELCRSLADFAKRLCSESVPFSSIAAYTASRLIPLDKSPGVRPIGVGEVVRRVIGRAVLQLLKAEILRATGTSQLCSGQPGGIEAAIHAALSVYEDPDVEAVLMVDATNAFKS